MAICPLSVSFRSVIQDKASGHLPPECLVSSVTQDKVSGHSQLSVLLRSVTQDKAFGRFPAQCLVSFLTLRLAKAKPLAIRPPQCLFSFCDTRQSFWSFPSSASRFVLDTSPCKRQSVWPFALSMSLAIFQLSVSLRSVTQIKASGHFPAQRLVSFCDTTPCAILPALTQSLDLLSGGCRDPARPRE